MPGSRLYNFSLAQPQFEIQPFQAVAFEPKERENINFLTNSLDKVEQRVNDYNKNLTAMDATFAQLQSNLSQDKDTLQWFENFKKKYKDQVNQFATLGDYSNAAKFGQRLAAEMLNDGELIGNIHAYETWKKEYDTVKQKAENSGDRLGLYLFEQQNKYTPDKVKWIKDDTGKVIGAENYNIDKPYFETIDYDKEIWAKGFQLINPDQLSKSSSRSSSSSRGNDYGTQSSSSESSHSTNISEIKPKEILKSWDYTVKALGISPSRIKYDFEARCAWRDKLQEEYDALLPSEQISEKGQNLKYEIDLYDSVLVHNNTRDYKSFYADMIAGGETAKAVAELMAYTHSSVSDSVGSSSGKTTHTPGIDTIAANKAMGITPNDNNKADASAYAGDSKPGNKVKMVVNKMANGISSAASNLVNTLTPTKKK